MFGLTLSLILTTLTVDDPGARCRTDKFKCEIRCGRKHTVGSMKHLECYTRCAGKYRQCEEGERRPCLE